ncbi:MAG TPA: hypothetical protein VFH08_15275 [Chitinophagaceae bacterium]|nr:hypothetical protein [Chitinophagaceae bacterium]
MRYILIPLLFVSIHGFSQCKTFKIGVKGDTLNCVDMKGKKQGRWVNELPPLRGEKGYEEQGIYINDKKEGQWQQFTLDGDLLAIENYRWGNKHGRCIYYTPFGQPIREESWKAVNPDNPYDTVDVFGLNDPSKVVRREVIKLDGHTLRHGTWKFFDADFGTVVKTEQYKFDKLVVAGVAEDELAPIDISTGTTAKSKTDSTGKKSIAKPKEVAEYEKKNAGKKKVKTRTGQTGY